MGWLAGGSGHQMPGMVILLGQTPTEPFISGGERGERREMKSFNVD